MTQKRKATCLGGLALVVLLGGSFIALFSPGLQAAIVAVSFVGYVACTRRALALCRADDLVFEAKASHAREEAAREAVRAGLLSGSIGAMSLGRSMIAAPDAVRSRSGQERPPFPRPLQGTR